jgi:MoaA/NifB/PqqE/SkfB family radical SAM enzyme
VLKEFAVKQVSKQILPLVDNLSDENLERLLRLSGKLAPTEETRNFSSLMVRLLHEGHPSITLVKRMIKQTKPQVRKKIINNLLINEYMVGSQKREQRRKQGLAGPEAFLISPTMRCNLACPGCYAAKYSRKDDLEFEVIDRVISEGKELGIYWITILGGEPFVHRDMWKIYQKHSDIFFQVFTNGTLIDKEVAKKLAKLGNVLVNISLEGFQPETDARRGKGIFLKIMYSMDNLREAGVPFGFSSMVTRNNVETIVSDEFNDMLISKGCLVGWHFLYIPEGRDAGVNLMPTAEQREMLRLRGAQRIRNEKPLFVVDFWNDAPYVGGCIAGGFRYFHINAQGDVEPCIFVHLATDNIKQKSLSEAINSPFFKGIRSQQPYGENLLRPCMIIDHPYVLRNLYSDFHPHPTDGPVCGFVANLRDDLDLYSQEVAAKLDPVWQSEFARKTNQEKTPVK